MATPWTLVPCLTALKAEFNALSPGRDRESDGAVGDVAHSAGGNSDHLPDEDFAALRDRDGDHVNEVHAIDVDKDLRSVVTMEQCVQAIVLRHRAGRDDRLQNVIWNGKIWSRSWGWTARTYTGANQHRKHAHFSARYTSAEERDVSPWGVAALKPKPAAPKPAPIVEEFVMASKEEVRQVLVEVLQAAHPLPGAVGRRLHAPKPEGPGWGHMSDREVLARVFEMNLGLTTALAALTATFAAFVESEEIDDQAVRATLEDSRAKLDEVRALLDEPEEPAA
jgi:hypothetical protein